MAKEADRTCPFCANDDDPRVIVRTRTMTLLLVTDKETDEVIPGRWHIVPTEHLATLDDLDPGWGASLVELIHETGLETNYNPVLNVGRAAGQRVMDHLHWWIIDRSADQFDIGLSALLAEHLKLASRVYELEVQVQRLREENITLRVLVPPCWQEKAGPTGAWTPAGSDIPLATSGLPM